MANLKGAISLTWGKRKHQSEAGDRFASLIFTSKKREKQGRYGKRAGVSASEL